MSEFKWKEECLIVPEGQNPVTQRQFFFQKYYDFFKKISEGRQKIVEIGCGRCTIGQYFARDGKDIECFDINPEAVKLAGENFKKEGLHGIFKVEDATRLPLGRYSRKYRDLIVSVGLIEHLEDRDWQKVFTEAQRVLRPGGALAMVNVPKKFSIQTFFQKHDHLHRENLTPEDYVQACKDAGFRATYWFYINPFPLIETKHERFITRVYQCIYWVRGLFMEYPMKGSKRWSQAHLLVAIK